MQKRIRHSEKHVAGFTLVELAVVLGTISILMALAMPEFQRSVSRARAIEAIQTANEIERQLVVYYDRNGQYPPAPGGVANPPQPVTAGRATWVDGLPGWSDIGFVGDGHEYLYRYEFIPTYNGAAHRYTQVTIHAFGQIIGEPTQDEFFIYLDEGTRVSDVEVGE